MDDASTLGKGGTLNAVGAVCFALLGFALVTIITRSLGAARRRRCSSKRSPCSASSAAPRCWVPTSAWCGSSPASAASTASRARSTDVRHRARARGRGCRPWPPPSCSSWPSPLGRLIGDAATEDQVAIYLRLMAPFIPVAALYMTLDGCAQGFGSMVPSVTVERIGRPLLVAGLVLGTVVTGTGTTALAISWATPWAVGFVAIAVWVTRLLTRTERPEPGLAAPRSPDARHAGSGASRSRGRSARSLQMGILWADTLLLGALASTGRPASTPRRPGS